MTESAATERLTQPLTKLQFGDSTFVNNDGLACLSKVALTDLSITACPNVSNGALSHIAEIAHLITLDLTGCGIDESGLDKVLSMTSLRALTLSCPLLTNDGLEPLSKLLALEELTFTSCYFNIDMEKFSKLTNLTSLTLSGTRNLASADLHHLTGLKLSKLNLEGCDVDDTGLSHLKTIITLTSLNLSCPHATKKGLQSINALKSLCELSLEYVDDIELKDLSTLRRLVSLSLKNSKRITGAGLREFSDHLTFLNVSGGQSFVELSDLASLALRRLDLNGCVSIQDEHLSYLSNMKFLRHLDLGNCTQITDAGLKNLTTSLQVGDIFTVPSLTSLNLSGCSKLGTTDIKRLRMIRNLAQLGVEVGIAELGDLPRLSSLRLACIVSKDDNFAKVTPIASLASLCLRGVDKTPILFRTNEMWAHVMTSLTIENIAFDGGVRENHGGLNELRALTCLRLINCQDIPLITELLNLKVLDVERSTTVDDDMLANFARNASLTSLNVSDCTLVTDTGLGHLVALPLLSRLNLNRCDKITSVGLRKLSTRFLRWIGLEACQKITWDAVRELRKDWCEVKLLPGADLTPRFDPPQEPLPAEEDNNDE